MGRSKPNKSRRPRSGNPAAPQPSSGPSEAMFWQPIRFACGHALEVGVETGYPPRRSDMERLNEFMTIASEYPCPRCGSATGVPHDGPVTGTPTYLRASGVWYRVCAQEVQDVATMNAELAAKRRAVMRGETP